MANLAESELATFAGRSGLDATLCEALERNASHARERRTTVVAQRRKHRRGGSVGALLEGVRKGLACLVRHIGIVEGGQQHQRSPLEPGEISVGTMFVENFSEALGGRLANRLDLERGDGR